MLVFFSGNWGEKKEKKKENNTVLSEVSVTK